MELCIETNNRGILPRRSISKFANNIHSSTYVNDCDSCQMWFCTKAEETIDYLVFGYSTVDPTEYRHSQVGNLFK